MNPLKWCKSKTCPNQNPQPVENFGRLTTSEDGLYYICKDCTKIRKKSLAGKSNGKLRISDEIVREARQLFLSTNLSVRDICSRLNCNVTAALYNKSHFDPDYNPPKRKLGRKWK